MARSSHNIGISAMTSMWDMIWLVLAVLMRHRVFREWAPAMTLQIFLVNEKYSENQVIIMILSDSSFLIFPKFLLYQSFCI